MRSFNERLDSVFEGRLDDKDEWNEGSDGEERGNPHDWNGVRIIGWSVGRDPTEFGWYIDDNRFTCADFDKCADFNMAGKRSGWDGIGELVGDELAAMLRDACPDLSYLCVWLSDNFSN